MKNRVLLTITIPVISFFIFIFSCSANVYGEDLIYPESKDRAVIGLEPSGTGSANATVAIEVPAGRNGIVPNLALTYNSNGRNSFLGVGWSLSLGEIQRSTKYDLDYGTNDYLLMVSGSSSELVPRGDWGNAYYGTKTEGAFSKFYLNPSTGGWEVTTNDGTKYFYGTTSASRQDNAYGIFRWLLDRVQDTNGNFMNVAYWKDTLNGEIYLDRIDYTGNTAGLSPTNYVKFYYEGRSDVTAMYTSNSSVRTAYRLKTVEVVANNQRVRSYKVTYAISSITERSLLASVQKFGTDVILDGSGTVTGGSSLPASTFTYTADSQIFSMGYSNSSICGPTDFNGVGDFNGDGKQDKWCRNGENRLFVSLSTGTSFGDMQQWAPDSVCTSGQLMGSGDFDGDGKTDVLCINSEYRVFVHHSTGSSFTLENWLNGWPCSGVAGFNGVGDFNGDGKQDIWCRNNENRLFVSLSSGTSFGQIQEWSPDSVCTSGNMMYAGDYNGDGKTDILCVNNEYNAFVFKSTGSSFQLANWLNAWPCSGVAGLNGVGDFNGDGKQDMWCRNNEYRLFVSLSTGTSFGPIQEWHNNSVCTSGTPMYSGDYNGDGKTDILCINNEYDAFVFKSTGSSFQLANWFNDWPCSGVAGLNGVGDFNGDGKQDMWCLNSEYNFYTGLSGYSNNLNDLLTLHSNGIGGTTSITYTPSSGYTNTMLPFVLQTLSSASVNDGNGNVSTTNYTYAGGLYDPEDREFRGFQYAKKTVPNGTTTEMWFHQDDIFKGLSYDHITKDSAGNIYTITQNTYDSVSPYTGVNFPRLIRKDDFLYDGTATYKQSESSFTYDDYGNVTRKSFLGDLAIQGDERDEYTEYLYDTVKWMVSRPSRTYIKDSADAIKTQAWFTYDPANGNLLTETAWLDGGTNPVTTYGYDSYGNRNSITDPKGNPSTTIEYDTTTHTYPVKVTNALGHFATTTYDYRFGAPLTRTDANENTTTFQYDVFGRIKEITTPDDGTSAYAWKESYYDGLGRGIKTRGQGPENKIITALKVYDYRGLVTNSSLPYFEGLETPRWSIFTYDPMGRVTIVDNPGPNDVTTYYDKGRTTIVDANGHKKVEEKDVYGRVIKVEEYTGVYPANSLYATTTYQYNILGNLLKVTDAANNQTIMAYDTLSRKTSMNDPDMGYWTYQYDANGNLTYQTDAKNQTIGFAYDAINRITLKDYPTGIDVSYVYDETFSTYSKGKLTTVTDGSGSEKFYYDTSARTVKSIKTVDSSQYTTETSYDALGRQTSIKYPDNDTVAYTYDTGGNLTGVGGYVTYSNFNAFGQAGTVTYANGVSTTQQFDPITNWLNSINTNSPSSGVLQNLSYLYDNEGSITTLSDSLNTHTQTFAYDELNRLTAAQSNIYGSLTWQYNQIGNMTYNSQIGSYTYNTNGSRPHAVTQAGSNIYGYDANGNMIDRAGKTIVYDYDNRATSISYGSSTMDSVYDNLGWRVKKITPSATTIYIGKTYECSGGTCTKYIFSGSQRIASKTVSSIYYYHTDHLGSSSIITDSAGNKVEETYYYPYGETRYNSGSINVKHKFTGQEEDAETELYYYGARYYDQQLSKFISPDAIVPEARDPQDLNRYAYVGNNPLLYSDPSGHWKLKNLFVSPEAFIKDPIESAGKIVDTHINFLKHTINFTEDVSNPRNLTNMRNLTTYFERGFGLLTSAMFISQFSSLPILPNFMKEIPGLPYVHYELWSRREVYFQFTVTTGIGGLGEIPFISSRTDFSWTRGRREITTNPDNTTQEADVHEGPFIHSKLRLSNNKTFEFYEGFRPTAVWSEGYGNEGDAGFGTFGRWMKDQGWGNWGISGRLKDKSRLTVYGQNL